MPTATFYLLDSVKQKQEQTLNASEHDIKDNVDNDFSWSDQERPWLLSYVLKLASHAVRQEKKVHINCHDEQEALALSELFCQVITAELVPYNLSGEGPNYGTCIEIAHQGITPRWNRTLIINLANCGAIFSPKFREVIDFVPSNENDKQFARERYKNYRQTGHQVDISDIHYP